ncbi:MAG: hypothetical protein KatS3mg103_0140 [Phycisphaerales bacterium]|nr:MAG: hypothetical protein KatS3mg103_0140 [Phycisphaerales bacterium]
MGGRSRGLGGLVLAARADGSRHEMKIIVGLGNPGAQYEQTRHNAGFMVVDELARRHAAGAVARGRFHAATLDCTIAGCKALLVKPTTFMNRSGLSVGEAVRFFKVDPSEDLLVVVDDIDLPLGAIRIRPGGSAGGHNGLADIARALGTDRYPRLRLGIDAQPKGASQVGYVLGRFTQEQAQALAPALARAADAVECILAEGLTQAMNRYNTPKARSPTNTGKGQAGPRRTTPDTSAQADGGPTPTASTPDTRPNRASDPAGASHEAKNAPPANPGPDSSQSQVGRQAGQPRVGNQTDRTSGTLVQGPASGSSTNADGPHREAPRDQSHGTPEHGPAGHPQPEPSAGHHKDP